MLLYKALTRLRCLPISPGAPVFSNIAPVYHSEGNARPQFIDADRIEHGVERKVSGPRNPFLKLPFASRPSRSLYKNTLEH